MRRAALLCVAVVAFLAVSLFVAPEGARTEARTAASPEQTTTTGLAAQLPAEQASFCHATSSVVKPYVLVTTAVGAIVSGGHGSHTGPVFPEVGPGQNGKWGDIIPPFDYDNGQQHFDGFNWPAGSAVLEAGCAVHETIEPPDGTTTTTTSTTTTVAITTETTAAATTTTGPTSSSTSSPSVGTSTTTPAPALTTTSAPSTSSTTTTPGQTTTTGLAAGSGATTTIAGGTTTTTVSGSTTTTSGPPPTGTPPPTTAPTPLNPPPVNALAPGEALPDPPPRVLAFVITPGNNLVRLGLLSPDQVRALFRGTRAAALGPQRERHRCTRTRRSAQRPNRRYFARAVGPASAKGTVIASRRCVETTQIAAGGGAQNCRDALPDRAEVAAQISATVPAIKGTRWVRHPRRLRRLAACGATRSDVGLRFTSRQLSTDNCRAPSIAAQADPRVADGIVSRRRE